MSHSTHVGFREPPVHSIALVSPCCLLFGPLPFHSHPVIVGNITDFLTSSANIFPPFPLGLLPGFPALGVGHIITNSSGEGVLPFLNASDRTASVPLGVPTNNPHSVSPVGRIDGTSWNNKRLDGVTRFFQFR